MTTATELREQINDLVYKVRKLDERSSKLFDLLKLFGKPSDLLDRVTSVEALIEAMRKPTFREQMIQEAAWNVPRYYSATWVFEAGDTERQPQSIVIDQEGWFFCDRIWATWRPTAGLDIGRFKPVSSGNAMIASATAGAVLYPTDILDFVWEYQEGRSQRTRQNLPIPSDILYRGDLDGFPPAGDCFGPNSTVQFNVTPTRAPENDGILQIVVAGVQTLKVLKQ